MKYRIIEERDANGKVFNYQLQIRFLFMWLPGPLGYSTLKEAQKALDGQLFARPVE